MTKDAFADLVSLCLSGLYILLLLLVIPFCGMLIESSDTTRLSDKIGLFSICSWPIVMICSILFSRYLYSKLIVRISTKIAASI